MNREFRNKLGFSSDQSIDSSKAEATKSRGRWYKKLWRKRWAILDTVLFAAVTGVVHFCGEKVSSAFLSELPPPDTSIKPGIAQSLFNQ